jgi:GNAT superfamily N-acetyltransferase
MVDHVRRRMGRRGTRGGGPGEQDVPGYEAVLHALALVTEPVRQAAPDDVAVEVATTWEQYSKSYDVFAEVFGTPPVADDVRRERWKTWGLRGCTVIASVEGQVVGAAAAGYGPTALTLLAGAVLPEARGRGVYTAMVHARWRVAVERRTPALTITAGRMSRPICERMGFQYLEPISIFVDGLTSA